MICDLAETYGIFDYKRLPPKMVASFLIGLRPNSRLKMVNNNQQFDLQTILLGRILDNLAILVWRQTKDGQKGKNPPSFISDILTPQEKEVKGFASGEEFEKVRKRLIEGGEY